MKKKFKLLKDDKSGFYRIQALYSFGDVKKGDIGGFVEGEFNLSHSGLSWVYDSSTVAGASRLLKDSVVKGNSLVLNSRLYNTVVDDGSVVSQSVLTNSEISKGSKVVNSVIKFSSVVSKTTIFQSDVYHTRISTSEIYKSTVKGTRTKLVKDHESVIGLSMIVDSNLHRNFIIMSSKLFGSYVKSGTNHHIYLSNVVSETSKFLFNVSVDVGRFVDCLVDRYSVLNSVNFNSVVCERVQLFQTELDNTTIKNVGMLNVKRLMFEQYGMLPDKDGYYYLYKKVYKDQDTDVPTYSSSYDPSFKYYLGEVSTAEDSATNPNSIHLSGLHCAMANYKHPGDTIIKVAVHIDDIRAISRKEIRCAKLKVVEEIGPVEPWM